MNRNVIIALTALALLGGFALAARTYKTEQAETTVAIAQTQSKVFVPDHAMRYGDPAAKVVIVEFFDPACETCAQFSPIVKEMADKNAGRVQIVYRYAPFHPGSEAVVALLEAARKQDRYWEALHALFSTQSTWTVNHTADRDKVWAVLTQVGLDMSRLQADVADPAINALIQQDIADAKTLGVKMTPEFFVNGAPLDPFGVDPLVQLVQREYAKVYK